MILLDFEKEIINSQKGVTLEVSDAAINEKYEKGEARIITEQGAVKLSLVNQVFNSENYELQPKYQRRITWDSKKRSKLIESFIMNIPVPPVFIYETDFNRYQVMDGLQRITAIIDFYKDCYELEELTQWPELNGKKYSQLPRKVKEGIDRRQLSVITLLKESSKTLIQEEEMKKMVFERLNTGGVTLEDQEIRNALYNGPFNELCILLSSNNIFRKLWLINPDDIDVSDEELDNYDDALKYAKNKLYKRMYDVELVLRYFAIDNVFNEYCLAIYGVIDNYDNLPEKMKEKHIKKLGDFLSNPQRYKNCELTDKQAVKNAVAAFNNPKEGFGNNQKLILSHGSNLKIEQILELANDLGIKNFENSIVSNYLFKSYFFKREIFNEETYNRLMSNGSKTLG